MAVSLGARAGTMGFICQEMVERCLKVKKIASAIMLLSREPNLWLSRKKRLIRTSAGALKRWQALCPIHQQSNLLHEGRPLAFDDQKVRDDRLRALFAHLLSSSGFPEAGGFARRAAAPSDGEACPRPADESFFSFPACFKPDQTK